MGFYYAAMALNFERLSIGSVGMVRRYFRELVAVVRELRRRRPAAARGSRGCASAWRAWRSTSRRRACSASRPRGRSSRAACRRRESSMAKIFVSELAQRVADAGCEILGLNGQLHPERADARSLHGRMQWLYRIAPMLAFGGGTNEVQRNIIAHARLRPAAQVERSRLRTASLDRRPPSSRS